MPVWVLAQSHRMLVASSLDRQPAEWGVRATLQSCFRAGIGINRTTGATGGLTKWQPEAGNRVPLARRGALKLGGNSSKSWAEVCKLKITVCVLRDRQADAKRQDEEDRSGSLLQLCYASLPLLPLWAWRKLFTHRPAAQPWAGLGRLFSIAQIKSTLSPAVSHTALHTSQRRDGANKEAHGFPSHSPEWR